MDPRDPIEITSAEAGAQDLDALAALHRALFVPPWTQGDFAALMGQVGSVALMAVLLETRNPVGFILGWVIADEAEILTVGVAPDWQRRGIAGRLVSDFICRAAERGAARVFLEVAADNAAARRLYLAQGFREVGRRRGYYDRGSGPAVDALVMSRPMAR